MLIETIPSFFIPASLPAGRQASRGQDVRGHFYVAERGHYHWAVTEKYLENKNYKKSPFARRAEVRGKRPDKSQALVNSIEKLDLDRGEDYQALRALAREFMEFSQEPNVKKVNRSLRLSVELQQKLWNINYQSGLLDMTLRRLGNPKVPYPKIEKLGYLLFGAKTDRELKRYFLEIFSKDSQGRINNIPLVQSFLEHLKKSRRLIVDSSKGTLTVQPSYKSSTKQMIERLPDGVWARQHGELGKAFVKAVIKGAIREGFSDLVYEVLEKTPRLRNFISEEKVWRLDQQAGRRAEVRSKPKKWEAISYRPPTLEEINEYLGVEIPPDSPSADQARELVVRTTKPLTVFRVAGSVTISWLDGWIPFLEQLRRPVEERGIFSGPFMRGSHAKNFLEGWSFSKNTLREYLAASDFSTVIHTYSVIGRARSEKGDPFISTTTSFSNALNRAREYSSDTIYLIEIPEGALVVDALRFYPGEDILLIPHHIPAKWVKKVFVLRPDSSILAPYLESERVIVDWPKDLLEQKALLKSLGLDDLNVDLNDPKLNLKYLPVKIEVKRGPLRWVVFTDPHRSLIETLQNTPSVFALLKLHDGNYEIRINKTKTEISDLDLLPPRALVEIKFFPRRAEVRSIRVDDLSKLKPGRIATTLDDKFASIKTAGPPQDQRHMIGFNQRGPKGQWGRTRLGIEKPDPHLGEAGFQLRSSAGDDSPNRSFKSAPLRQLEGQGSRNERVGSARINDGQVIFAPTTGRLELNASKEAVEKNPLAPPASLEVKSPPDLKGDPHKRGFLTLQKGGELRGALSSGGLWQGLVSGEGLRPEPGAPRMPPTDRGTAWPVSDNAKKPSHTPAEFHLEKVSSSLDQSSERTITTHEPGVKLPHRTAHAEVRRQEAKATSYEERKAKAFRLLFSIRDLEPGVTEANRDEIEREGIRALVEIAREDPSQFGETSRLRRDFRSELRYRMTVLEKAGREVPLKQVVLELMPDFSAEALVEKFSEMGISFATPKEAEDLSKRLIAALGEFNLVANQVVTRAAERRIQEFRRQKETVPGMAEDVKGVISQIVQSVQDISIGTRLPAFSKTPVDVYLRIDATNPERYDSVVEQIMSFVKQMGQDSRGRILIYSHREDLKHQRHRPIIEKALADLRGQGVPLQIDSKSYATRDVGIADIEIRYRGSLAKGYGAIVVTPEMLPRALNQALHNPSQILEEDLARLMNQIMAGLAVKLGKIRDPKSAEAEKLRGELNQKLGKYGIKIDIHETLGNLVATWDLNQLLAYIMTEVATVQAQRAAA